MSDIVTTLAAVMADVRSIGKKDFNDFHKFNFRGIDTVLDKVAPALREHGVVVTPEIRDLHSDDLTAKDGKRKRGVTVTVAYTFYGPDGDSLTAVVPGEANDTEDKASSKAMSVAFRTALLQALAIPTGEPDPHAGPPVSTKLATLRAEAKELMASKGWAFQQMADDYAEWSQGGEIGAADEAEMEKYVARLRPTKTMRRQQ
ncbi:MAG: ERF family protein [Streptosporangiales bacterium]